MNVVGAALVVVLFAVLLHIIGLVARTREVLSIGHRAAATMRDTALTDAHKERLMQQNSLRLFRLLAELLLGTAIALLGPLALIWLAQLAGWVTVEGVLAMFLRWDFIAGATVLGIAAYITSAKWLNRNS